MQRPSSHSAARKSAGFNIPGSSSADDEEYVEITLDVSGDDSVAVHRVKPAGGLLARTLEQEGELPVLPHSGPPNKRKSAPFNIPKSSSSAVAPQSSPSAAATADDEGTSHGHADTQPEDAVPVVPLSGPLNNQGERNTAHFNVPTADGEAYVEITLDVRDDSVAVQSVMPAGGGDTEALEKHLRVQRATFASNRIKHVSQELRRLASLSKRPPGGGRIDGSKSATAHAFKGLEFISKTDGWLAVEKRFDELAKDGSLPKSLFSQCIGMKESKEFDGELFDALARRRYMTGNSINKMELREFWDQISDQSFDSLLQTFWDMVDKNADGRITEEEVIEIIAMSASANKLSKIQDQAEDCARLIMEELDPNNLGYIEINNLETLLRMGTNNGHGTRFNILESSSTAAVIGHIQYSKPLKKRGGGKSTRFNILESSSSAAATADDEGIGRIDMLKWPVVHALKGLKFTSKSDWSNGWLDRTLRSSIRPVKILKVAVYPGNFLGLHISKPQGFKYRSGQHMFVSGKAFSPFEWHPFFITSAPLDDYISVHITTLGDSTRQLKTLFSGFCQPSTGGKSGLLRADYEHSENSLDPSIPKVLIDGPYGAPAEDYKKYEVVLLVGLEIGATPFISVVKDIVNNLKELDSESPLNGDEDIERGGSESDRRGKVPFKTRRAYFYWVTTKRGSFEWFKRVMNEVAESDKKGAIELHNYCTSVYEEGEARLALITMLQSLKHAKHGVDVVSGTTVKSHFAHPNWRHVYKSVALNHRSQRVGVFYCGPPTLTKELREHALEFSDKTSTKFDFHKENF